MEAGTPIQLNIQAKGGFAGQFQYRPAAPLPEGLRLQTNPDLTGTLSGTLDAGTHQVVIEVDEAFAGSPVTTVVYYTFEAK